MLFLGEAAHTILNDNYRSIDDDAKVKGTEAHQISAYLVLDHPRNGEEHRKRNNGRYDQCGTKVPKQREKNHYNQRRALKKVLPHSFNGGIDQISPVVNRCRGDSSR